MTFTFKNILKSGLFIFCVFNLNAQKKEIGSEVVNVVKPYTPTLSDAFKIKEVPNFNDAEMSKKIVVKYSIFSFPVASTFSPTKGKATDLPSVPTEKQFKNFLSVGFGNYTTANVDFHAGHNIAANQYLGFRIGHESSQGGIKNVLLNNQYYSTLLALSHELNQENFTLKSKAGFQHKIFNWYGLPVDFATNLSPVNQKLLVDGIDPVYIMNDFFANGSISFKESFVKEANLQMNYFWDNYGTAENQLVLKPSFEFKISDKVFNTNISLNHVSGNLNNMAFASKHSWLALGLNPNYSFVKNDFVVNLGLNLVMNADNIASKNEFFVYPKVTASYNVVNNLMTAFAGLVGDLNQNSYREFANQNPFIAPTFSVLPTDSRYNLFVGLKGKFTNVVGYSISGSLLNERNKALFKSNNFSTTTGNANFANGNSFGIVYDNIRTISLNAELKAIVSKNIEFTWNGNFNTFTTTLEKEAWNLPQIEMQFNSNITFSEKWFGNLNLFFTGERKDEQINFSVLNVNTIKTLDVFIDANMAVGYNYTKRLSGFLKANNILNQGYQRWLNFPVQQFQIIVGASYKFDF